MYPKSACITPPLMNSKHPRSLPTVRVAKGPTTDSSAASVDAASPSAQDITRRMRQVLLSFCLATLDPTFSATVDCCSGTNIKSAQKKDCTAHTMKLQHVKGPTFQRLLPNEHAVSTSEHDESSLVASRLHHYHHQNHRYHHRYHHHHHHHPQSL